jgi:hypothetical protein
MTKDKMLEKYKAILKIEGMEKTALIVYEALGMAYDAGFTEGVKVGSKINAEIANKIFNRNLLIDK